MGNVKTLGGVARLLGVTIDEHSKDAVITGVTSHSGKISDGNLFLAVPGGKVHGASFAGVAKGSGAIAIVTDTQGASQIEVEIPVIVIEGVENFIGDIATWFYGRPSSRMRSYGITGTNGKTTTASLLSQLMKFQNRSVGVIGTLGAEINGELIETGFTTPQADQLQWVLHQAVTCNVTDLVMEVSSHSLTLGRVRGTSFAMVGFTNLTQDHLDFHHDMESYFQAKKKLFTQEYSSLGFVNIDNPYGARLALESEIEVRLLSKDSRKATWHFVRSEATSSGYSIAIRGIGGILVEGDIHLMGEHNLDNVLMAVAMAIESGLDPLAVGNDLSRLHAAPGRLEQVVPNAPFIALVDYAHTPDAVEHALVAMKSRVSGKVIAVLGCGGDRDATKRPIMGDCLVQGSDIAIMTSDNPRSEAPELILSQMMGKHVESSTVICEVDRRRAIALAVTLAEPGDCVIVLGKGHETGQLIQGVKHPFDDRIELARAIELLV